MEKTIEMMKLLKWSNNIEFNNLNTIIPRKETQWQKNIYFCAGVKEWVNKRCNDDDITLKKYFVVDIDIRLDCYLQTGIVLDHDQLLQHMENIIELLHTAWLDDYSIAVCSGNWLHLYYVGTERSFDKDIYSHWVQIIYEKINEAIKNSWYKCDPACHNISRIMRLPWTINPRKKEKKEEILWDLWDYVCDVMVIEEKKSELFENIEIFALDYDKENDKEREDATKVHQIIKSDYKKSDDIRSEINKIPACDVACDIRPITISDKWKDNVALKEDKKNMGAYWYRPHNVIVNTGSSLIKTNKSYFTTYELVYHEYANQDKQRTLDYFKTKYNIEVKNDKKTIDIQPIKYDRQWYIYWNSCFDKFDCSMSWELMVIVALSNTWKTTFAMDMIQSNVKIWKKCFYINLEFAIETVRQSRWLYANGYKKRNLTDLEPLSPDAQEKMDNYVNKQLKKFDSYSNPKWIALIDLVEMIKEKQKQGYGFFVVDTFSRIEWNLDSSKAHTSQNEAMQILQDLCQAIWVVIVLLHHTNKKWEFEWSQKIMDLANVFIVMSRDEDLMWDKITKFSLTKDKFISHTEIEAKYENWEYTNILPL